MIRLCPRQSLAALLVTLLVSACSSVPTTDPGAADRAALYRQKAAGLGAVDHWALEGRLAVRSAGDGGSGHFSWTREDEKHEMNFHGALGRGAWRLTADASETRLEQADGTVHTAATPDQLARRVAGWDVPVEQLSWWVRGLTAPGAFEAAEYDELGNLQGFRQSGWSIELGRYRQHGQWPLPSKITAERDSARVKLAIREWRESIDGRGHD